MTVATKRIADDLIASLPEEERIELAEMLLRGVGDFASPDVEEAWNKEIDRRLDEYEAGRAELHTEAEVEARVRNAIDEARRTARRRHA